MRTSYEKNHYGDLITSLTKVFQPKTIIEFGILDGYSLLALRKGSPQARIQAFDIFNQFPGNHAISGAEVLKLFSENPPEILEGNFYKQHLRIQPCSIDMFHIDIANTGHTYQFFLDNYISKLVPGGIALLEGGSIERDNVSWMIKYNFPKIQSVLKICSLEYFTFEAYPSMTIIKKP